MQIVMQTLFILFLLFVFSDQLHAEVCTKDDVHGALLCSEDFSAQPLSLDKVNRSPAILGPPSEAPLGENDLLYFSIERQFEAQNQACLPRYNE